MKTKIPKDGFIENIDTANEEIARLDAKLGNGKREFEENIDTANDLVATLEAEVAALPKPAAKPPVATPKVTEPTPKVPVTKSLEPVAQKPAIELTGLQRAIAANSAASAAAARPKTVKEATGIQRAINANVRNQKKK